MNIIQRNSSNILRLAIGCYTLLIVALTGFAFWHGTYHVAEEDETIYYNTARCFAQTGTVRAVDCNTEDVSKIGQCNWYGPMYNIFYGSITKLVGFHNYNFLLINLLCLGLIAWLIWQSAPDKEAGLMILTTLLALYPVVGYIFTYFPETLELLFAVMLSLKLKKLFTNTATTGQIVQFIVLVLFFALFRVTTVFWVFGLLALSNSIKDFVKYLFIGMACFFLTTVYTHYFIAPAFGNSMGYLTSHGINPSTLLYFLKKTLTNIYTFFTRNPFYDLLQIPVLFIAIYSWFISKNRFMLAAVIVSFIYYCILLVLYVPYSYFFNKQVACLYPLMLMALFITDTTQLKHLVTLLVLLLSPFTYIKAARYVMAHKNSAVEYNQKMTERQQLNIIAGKTAEGHPITVLTLYREFDSVMTYPVFVTSVPVVTTDKQPILYTDCFPIEGAHSSNFKYENNFQFYHKLHIDYILSKHPLQMDSTTLSYSCNLFYLYRNNRTAK